MLLLPAELVARQIVQFYQYLQSGWLRQRFLQTPSVFIRVYLRLINSAAVLARRPI